MGVEPTLSAWEAEVLPINYIREHWQYNTAEKKIQYPETIFFHGSIFRQTMRGGEIMLLTGRFGMMESE